MFADALHQGGVFGRRRPMRRGRDFGGGFFGIAHGTAGFRWRFPLFLRYSFNEGRAEKEGLRRNHSPLGLGKGSARVGTPHETAFLRKIWRYNMKYPLTSALMLTLSTLFGALGLTGCADTPWPSWLTGEPDRHVLQAPRLVGRPPSVGQATYPSLSQVPEKPKDLPSQAQQQVLIDQLSQDRQQAQEARQRLEALPTVQEAVP